MVQLHLSVDTREKTCSNRVPHMTCFAAKHLRFDSRLKQTVAPKVSCLYVFDQRVPLIFHFSQLSDIFLAQKQHTCLQRLFLTSKNSANTSNFECLAAKHVMFAPS